MGLIQKVREAGIFARAIGGYGRGIFGGTKLYLSRFYLKIFSLSAIPNTTLAPPSEVIPPEFFGMHIEGEFPNSWSNGNCGWPSIEFGARRLWDAGVSWNELEPTKGNWNWTTLDRYITGAIKHGVKQFLTLGGTPRWAASDLPTPPMNGGGYASPPKNMQDWRNYVTQVVSHCKGTIEGYEIWNEPDLLPWKSDVIKTLVELTDAAGPIIHQIDPKAGVLSPGFSEDVGIYYQARFLSAGGGKHVDVMSHHFYVEPRGPEMLVPIAQTLRRTMNNYGMHDKPLWNTETGWLTSIDQQHAEAPDSFITASKLAGYIARLYVLAWAVGMPRAYWYSWDGGIYGGMIDGKGTPNEAAGAYQQVRSWLLGATMLSCVSDKQNTWICILRQKDGNLAWIIWNPDSADLISEQDTQPNFLYHVAAPAGWMTDLTGQKTAVGIGADTTIGIRPILFTVS